MNRNFRLCKSNHYKKVYRASVREGNGFIQYKVEKIKGVRKRYVLKGSYIDGSGNKIKNYRLDIDRDFYEGCKNT